MPGRAAQGEGRALAGAVTLPQVDGNTLTLFPGQANQTPIDYRCALPRVQRGQPLRLHQPVRQRPGRGQRRPGGPGEPAGGRLGHRLRLPGPARERRPLPSRHDQRPALVPDRRRPGQLRGAGRHLRRLHHRDHLHRRRAPDPCAGLPHLRAGGRLLGRLRDPPQLHRPGDPPERLRRHAVAVCGDGLHAVDRRVTPSPPVPAIRTSPGPCRSSSPRRSSAPRSRTLWYEDYIDGPVGRNGVNHYAHTAGRCENDDSPTVWVGHDVTDYFRTAGEKQVLLALIQGGNQGGGTVTIRIRFDPSQAVVADTWEDDPACLDLVRAIGDGACEGAIQCAAMPALTDGCIPHHRRPASAPADLRPSPVAGISSLCQRITVSADCSGFYQGQMDCWTDPQGVLQCPYNQGGVATDCTALEADPNCGFLSSSCVKYAQGASGLCYVFEETWDCGTLHSIPVLERISTMDCAGPVRCMGEDCLDTTAEAVRRLRQGRRRGAAGRADGRLGHGLHGRDLCGLLRRGHGVQEGGRAASSTAAPRRTGFRSRTTSSLVFAMGKLDNALHGARPGQCAARFLGDPAPAGRLRLERGDPLLHLGRQQPDGQDRGGGDRCRWRRSRSTPSSRRSCRQTAQWVAELFGEAAANSALHRQRRARPSSAATCRRAPSSSAV